MIILWALTLVLAFYIGYKSTEKVQDLLQQRTMNKWRSELGLPTKPLTLLTANRV